MTSMNNLKEHNTLVSSLQQKVSKTRIRNWKSLTKLYRRIVSISAETPLFSRHNSILKTSLFYLTSINKYDVFANVERYISSALLFNSSIPDTVVIKDDILYTIKLTLCFETNFLKIQNYQRNINKSYQTK